MSNTRTINAKAKSDMFKFVDMTKSSIQKVNREVLLEIGRRLVVRSPVGDPTKWHPPYWPKGYIPGHFKNNWQVGIDKRPIGTIPGVDYSGAASIERMSHLGRWTVGHTYYFVNNLPYAYMLEMGHSTQCPPGGMVGLIKREFAQIVAQKVEEFKGGVR